jgi:segregation and condensation protein B
MNESLKNIIEAAIMSAETPLSISDLRKLFDEIECPDTLAFQTALAELAEDYKGRGIELKEVASGFRFQARQEYAAWLTKMNADRVARYSRSFLETLVLVAYRQPITRGEIEDIRGVAVNTNVIKTLIEREWIKVVGHRDVPGKPELLGTTKTFLDYFNLKSLEQLPDLSELTNLDVRGAEAERQLELQVETQTEEIDYASES